MDRMKDSIEQEQQERSNRMNVRDLFTKMNHISAKNMSKQEPRYTVLAVDGFQGPQIKPCLKLRCWEILRREVAVVAGKLGKISSRDCTTAVSRGLHRREAVLPPRGPFTVLHDGYHM